MNPVANMWLDLFKGYFCVFVGKPEDCTPYAIFATEQQARNFNGDITNKYPVITVDDWMARFNPKGPVDP